MLSKWESQHEVHSVNADGSDRGWKGVVKRERVTDLVPVAVVLRGVVVVLQHFGDGALINALKTELPLTQLQEAPRKGGKEGLRGREREGETVLVTI